LLLGSHLDTVRNAGKYDGMLGVVTGIEPAAGLVDPTETDWRHFNAITTTNVKTVSYRRIPGRFQPDVMQAAGLKSAALKGASVIEVGMLVAVSPGALARVTRARGGHPQFGSLTMCKHRGTTACRLPTATPQEPTAW